MAINMTFIDGITVIPADWLNHVNAVINSAVPGSGTVTEVLGVNGNGFTWSIATPTSTPTITLATSVTGLVKGNGTALSAAVSGTDYAPGTSGLATGVVKSTTATGALTIAANTDLPVGDATHSGAVPTPPNDSTKVLRGNMTWGTVPAVSGLTLLATVAPTAAASIDALTTFSASYDNYLIQFTNIAPASYTSTPICKMRFANGGVLDTTSSYVDLNLSSLSSTTATSWEASGSLNAGIFNMTMYVNNANDATNVKTVSTTSINNGNATTDAKASQTFLAYLTAAAVSGVSFFWSNGANFVAQGDIRIYGYNN